MPTSRPDFRHGRIVWANLRCENGQKQEHPAVILSLDSQIVQPENFDPHTGGDNVIVVAGISTKYKGHPHPYVKLPFHPSGKGHPVTELRQDCAAIIGWYHLLFIADDVTAFSGDVPPDVMRTLNAKI